MENNNASGDKNHKDANESKTRKNKGTGMSSEGGSTQSEESWQGINGGTMSNAQLKSKNQGNENVNNNEDHQNQNKKQPVSENNSDKTY